MQERAAPWWRSLNRYQWIVLIIAWLGWVFDVFDTSLFFLAKQSIIMEFVGPRAYDKGGPGPRYEAWVLAAFTLGWAVGGFLFGVLADRWGRAKTMILTILVYCGFTLATLWCRNLVELAVVRFFTGLGIGGEWAAGTALVAEVVPNRVRSAAAGVLQTAAALGPVLAALANLALAACNWRWLFVVGVLPAALTVWIRLGVKEPERWRRSREDRRSTIDVLRDFRREPKWLAYLAVAFVVAVVGIMGAGNISFWLPNLVKEVSQGFSPSDVRARQSFAQMIMHIGTILGVVTFPMLCERFGRKKSFIAFFCLCPFVVGGVTFLLFKGLINYEGIVLLAPAMAFFALGLTSGYPLYLPELFPTRLRATGMGLAYNTGRLLQIPWPIITASIITAFGGVAVGVGLTALVYFVGAFAMLFAPETKGKPLPD